MDAAKLGGSYVRLAMLPQKGLRDKYLFPTVVMWGGGSMLTRLEVAYLALLRVVLLIAATLALVVTVGAGVAALPALGELVGVTGNAPTRGGTLREFIEANRITDVQQSVDDTSDPSTKLPLPEQLREASRNFAKYDSRNGGRRSEQSDWDDLFRTVLTDKVPAAEHEDYGADVVELSAQLNRSTGKALSDERLYQLIEYHLESFLANAHGQELAKAGALAGSMSKLFLAGSAFLVFVLVLFSFLFVKIERNLRARLVADEPSEPSELFE